MQINLSLLCRTLALFTLCRLASADESENQNVDYLPRNSLYSHYPVRFEKLSAAAAALEDSPNVYSLDGSSSSNDAGLSELNANEDSGSFENDSSDQTEFGRAAEDPAGQLSSTDSSPSHIVNEHPDAVPVAAVPDEHASDDQGALQREQLGDLVPNHSNHQSHRLTRRKDSKSEQPNEKQVIEFNSLDDQPTYSEVSDDKHDDDDNGLIKYKAKHNFEYSTNLLDDDFFKNAKMLVAGDSEFAYDDQEAWPGTCNDASAKQSPIAINWPNTVPDLRLKLDIGVKYAKDLPVVELENNGHTVQFLIPRSAGDLIITGPAVDYEMYKATALHFHWGKNDSVGSEHVINNQRFPLEMHIVHYNTKYVNLEEALKHDDGTLVIGIMFKAGKRRNEAIEPLIRKLDQVRCRGQKTDLREMNLLRLFPSKVRRFFQYTGSLTTPPCTPTVNWIVIENPNMIASEQLAKFRQLTEDPLCQTPLTRNWRDLQDLKNRDIKRSNKA